MTIGNKQLKAIRSGAKNDADEGTYGYTLIRRCEPAPERDESTCTALRNEQSSIHRQYKADAPTLEVGEEADTQ
jgi:hypothetical protein